MLTNDYARIEKIIGFLDANFRDQPTLKEIAATAGLSEYHFQRLFRRWVGISPKRFIQYLTADYAGRLLRKSPSLLEASYETGLSGPSRLHDLIVNVQALTPGELKNRGAGLTIRHGVHPTPFGPCLLSMTERGVCGLAFISARGRKNAVADLQRQWPRAIFREDLKATRPIVERIFARRRSGGGSPLNLLVKGTNFQIKVWEALLRVPPGSVVSYEELAKSLGAPRATRAAANAVARNSLAFLIPCHRVIRKSGAFGKYRWGAARKKAILGWEASQGRNGR